MPVHTRSQFNTPRKANDITKVLVRLNRKFSIGVGVPDDMSRADRRARAARDPLYAQWVKIWDSLQFLSESYQEMDLEKFESAATALCKTWGTPGSRRRAETPGQQLILQSLLVEMLGNRKSVASTPSTTSPRKPTSFTDTYSVSSTNNRTTLNQRSAADGESDTAFHPVSPSFKRENMWPADSSPTKKPKRRQPSPIDHPLGTTKQDHSPAPAFGEGQRRDFHPFAAIPGRQRVTPGAEIEEAVATDRIDLFGRTLTAVANTTEANNNINPAPIVPADSVSVIGARVEHPPSQVSTSGNQFFLPIRQSQPQTVLDSRPVDAEHNLDDFSTDSDAISEASFHSATSSVDVNTNHADANMNHVAGSHQAQQPARFSDPVATANHTPQRVGQHRGGIPPDALLSHQVVQNVVGPPSPVTSGKPVTPPLAIQYVPATPPSSRATTVQDRLDLVWPKIPHWLEKAPLAIIWEVTRIGLHCKVDLETLNMRYNRAWEKDGIKSIWADFRRLDEGYEDKECLFKSFPEHPSPDVFETALATFATPESAVVMSASLDWNKSPNGPLFHITMRPLRLEQACRLTRRFGADRFFEILIPSPTGGGASAPACMKDPKNQSLVIDWLANTKHEFVGRFWQAFFTRAGGARKPAREYRLEPDAKPVFKERVNFFAENGYTFCDLRPPSSGWVPMADEPLHRRCSFRASQMLDWLLCIKDNQDQPYLKLFSRIQLGLSQTTPILVFQQDQIIHRKLDIMSPIGKEMNDGIGLMSRSVARKVRDKLGLTDIPSAIQGRIGSAKGMWLIDVTDLDDDLWIETYPSQRKWRCDQTDEHQRTLEVRATSLELRSAGLNLQLLPVLEAQASNRELMKAAISRRLTQDLEDQFKGQQDAFNDPILLRQWMAANFNGRASRVKNGSVPMLGGMPESKEEGVLMLLNSNFVPREQAHMAKMIWDLQMQKCEQLKTKLNVKVSQSAYVYMVVDFWGVLDEGEVHLGFSNKFHAEGSDESLTLLTNRDVLVTRSPAHFPSDIQKVRAVFKSELASLKDVIVFSKKGNVPLADKLSGGDYDGDQAWVCWDEEIVGSFQNAEVPEQPDLSKYMKKNKTTFGDLTWQNRGGDMLDQDLHRQSAVYDLIGKAFHFSMQQDYLGICTNFKEKACYWRKNVTDDVALTLSTLVGQLVDQSKQGITFDGESWNALRADLGVKQYGDPRYKADAWQGEGSPTHIIDHLKFNVAIPVIAKNLTSLHELARRSNEAENDSATPEGGVAHLYDRDLCKLSNHQDDLAAKSKTHHALLESLNNELAALRQRYSAAMGRKSADSYVTNVRKLHEEYRAITLQAVVAKSKVPEVDCKTKSFLDNTGDWIADPDRWSMWALVKASRLFKLFYRFNNGSFLFAMAGEQLAYLKAMATVRPDAGLAPMVAPLMWAGTGCDQRFAKQWTAKRKGDEATEYLGEGAVDWGRPEVFGQLPDGFKPDGDDGW